MIPQSLAAICKWFVIAPMIMKFGTDIKLDVFYTMVKSVQSALSDLLTTSATHSTFSRPSTKRGLILIGLQLNTNARE